jgi:SulP family sulfate permease
VASTSKGALIISAVSLGLLMLWDKAAKKSRLFHLLPGPLAVVMLGIGLNQAFGVIAPALKCL